LTLLSPWRLAYLEKYSPSSALYNYASGSFFITPPCVRCVSLNVNKILI
jgi:hypothetical protein